MTRGRKEIEGSEKKGKKLRWIEVTRRVMEGSREGAIYR